MMLKDYLKSEGEYIVFNGPYMECYIPAFYFETNLGEVYGSSLRVFGIFNVRAFTEGNKPGKLETFNFPSILTIYPTETETTTLTLVQDGESEPEKYIVAKFYKGNRLMRNAIPKDSSNVELFINLMTKGKIPRTIPYNQILDVWLKNLIVNDVKLQVVSSILESIITQFYRDAKKPELRFSQTYGKNPSIGEYAYKPANIRELCARNSTFAALTFEDMDSMITSSINISKYNKKEIESPLEKILKM
jgi:hypothetical protein